MKKKSIVSLFLPAFLLIVFVASAETDPPQKTKMPDNVKAVVDKSCFGCHNTDSRNEDAKEDLDFKKLDKLSTIKKIGTYKKIGEAIEKEEMPPKKFIERYPEKQLTDEEKQILLTWTKKEAETLVKSK
ncbi:heme-binding domain-containing protein [Prolixibacteraceae bacterium Z1-6]|uniref:Heme-binding domain-containing protein n=1 Tax=Draconibacterium aestuarii TaxID=2998507 RepID=A0A9X3J5Y4_9BACT|nr:heme-binding domain-containing protein [Prolixibacteraceae bacterium Z1-6]